MTGPFSAASRERHWAVLGTGTWDLLVIGGGATGSAIARNAAGCGLRTALVEAGDFAQGTSSRSSRLIHGGLRYLETRDFRLVFEASAERRRLLSLAPHLVRPLPFLFPVYQRDPVGLRTLQAGMWLYDLLALFRNLHRHRMLGRREALAREPALQANGLRGAAVYYDAAVDDARLTLATARGAHDAGACTVSHAELTAFCYDKGRISGAVVRDRLHARAAEIAARVVVNATGPWSDAVRRLADPEAQPRLRPTKGVHIMLRRERLGARGAIIFRSCVDGRVMFALPWGARAYVGTTDTDFEGSPADAAATPEDLAYLLASANGLFPGQNLSAVDILSSWAGVRPLLAPAAKGGTLTAGQTSREHEVWRDSSGLLNIAGGKLTTFRVMADDAADEVASLLREEHDVRVGQSATAAEPFPGTPGEDWEFFVAGAVARAVGLGLSDDAARHLVGRHGADVDRLLARIAAEPPLAEPVQPGHPYLWVEVDWAVEEEMALTLADVLERRLHLFYEAEDGGTSVSQQVATRMAQRGGLDWSDARIRKEVLDYGRLVQANRALAAADRGRA